VENEKLTALQESEGLHIEMAYDGMSFSLLLPPVPTVAAAAAASL
jgi:tellurite resistance protein TehA-like permease